MGVSVLSMLPAFTAAIAQAKCRDTLQDALGQSLAAMGFRSFNLGCHKKNKHELALEPTLASWSPEFMAQYRLRRIVDIDPILDRAAITRKPFVWTVDSIREENPDGAFVAFLCESPLKGGVSIPLPRRAGTISSISIECHEEPVVCNETIHAAAVVAQFALLKSELLGLCPVRGENGEADLLAALSSQQIEIMRWVSEGKTNAEIAIIMSASERTVKYHIGEILRKWDVSSRARAAQMFGKITV